MDRLVYSSVEWKGPYYRKPSPNSFLSYINSPPNLNFNSCPLRVLPRNNQIPGISPILQIDGIISETILREVKHFLRKYTPSVYSPGPGYSTTAIVWAPMDAGRVHPNDCPFSLAVSPRQFIYELTDSSLSIRVPQPRHPGNTGHIHANVGP